MNFLCWLAIKIEILVMKNGPKKKLISVFITPERYLPSSNTVSARRGSLVIEKQMFTAEETYWYDFTTTTSGSPEIFALRVNNQQQ